MDRTLAGRAAGLVGAIASGVPAPAPTVGAPGAARTAAAAPAARELPLPAPSWPPVALALVAFLAHMLVAGNYGYFRDELYYIAAGRHLAWGYVDFPPFVALLAALTDRLAGDGLVALHVWPALAGALLVLLTGLLAREFGGGRFAQGLAALASLAAVTYLAIASIFSMDAWDELWWTLAAFVLIRAARQGRPRLWLLFGLVAGIGLLTKLTMLFLGLALLGGLLLTPRRRELGTRWPWLGGLIAALPVSPFVAWQVANGWPSLAFGLHYGGNHSTGISPLGFLFEQVYTMNPLTLPLWVAGLAFLLAAPAGRPYRFLGWAFVLLWLLFTLLHSKSYFLAPAYSFLFAAGAVALERATARSGRRWLRPAYAPALAALGLLLAPVAMPILPPATWARVYGFLGGDAGAQQDPHQTGLLPQWLADRFGWPTMTATVAAVYRALPAADRDQACVYTLNYGEAAALSFFGPAAGLPPAISGHNSFALWGPGSCSGRVLITVGVSKADLRASFGSVTAAAIIACRDCMPEEDNLPVYVARDPTLPVGVLWQGARHFN